jgi:integrase
MVKDKAPHAGLATSRACKKDILSLERRQIKDGVLTITASKTGKKQTFPVAGDLKENIDAALAEKPQLRHHVIVNRKGKPYSRDGFQSQWQRVMLKAAKLGVIQEKFTFHDIRAKNLSEAKTLEEAASRARHSDPRITQDVYRRLPETSTVADIGHLKR